MKYHIKTFKAYRHQESYCKKINYLDRLISARNKMRARKRDTSNYYTSRVIKLCIKCFMLTFNKNYRVIRTIIKKIFANEDVGCFQDKREMNLPANKLSEEKMKDVKRHI